MPYWRRTLYTIWITQFLAILGFSFTGPFMAYYIQSLGVSDVKSVALWTGLSGSATAIAMAIMSPIWGALADRYGRKIMILRATIIGSVIMALMGLVVSPEQLVFLRLLQGIFTGTMAASTSLVAGMVPEERCGAALGSLQTAVFLGFTLGPLLGGAAGDAFGYRPSFMVTGGLLLLSGILVALLVTERFQPAAAAAGPRRSGLRRSLAFLMASGGLLASLLLARMLVQGAMMVSNPTLPLFVQSLLPSGDHPALVTGLISGAMALGGALGAPILGAWGDRLGRVRLMVACAALGVVGFLPQALAPNVAWLVGGQFVVGVAQGGALANGMALLAVLARGGHEGTVFGLDASANGIAASAGPLLGATVAASLGLRAPFVFSAAILVAGAVVITLRARAADAAAMAERAEPA